MYPACILITLADTCISHVNCRMYPACILHLRYVPIRIHLRYMYPNMYLWSIPHVSLMYPRTTADTFIPHVSLINLACTSIMHVSCMYPRTSADTCIPHGSRMDPAWIPHGSFMYPDCILKRVVMTRPRYMYRDFVSRYIGRRFLISYLCSLHTESLALMNLPALRRGKCVWHWQTYLTLQSARTILRGTKTGG